MSYSDGGDGDGGGFGEGGYGGYSTGSSGNFGGTPGNIGGYSPGYGGEGGNSFDAPDIGTLGGTMSDPYGENSVTQPGTLNQDQSFSNEGVNQNPFGYDFGMAGYNEPQSWSLSSFFGDPRKGLPSYNQLADTQAQISKIADNFPGYGDRNEVSGWDHPAVKFARTLMGFNPMGAAVNLGINAVRGQDVGAAILGRAAPGPLGAVLGAGYNAARSDNPAQSLGVSAAGTLGSIVGGNIAGPIGAMVGGKALGGLASSNAGKGTGSDSSAGSQNNGGGTDWGKLAGTLYQGYQANRQAGQLANNAQQNQQALQAQMSGLQNMYAPDSPYAKQLAQQLARQDAKAGRNSQYGTRAVELQARLAALAPTVANSMSSLGQTSNLTNTQAQTANNNRQAVQAQILSQLIGSKKDPGYLQQGFTGLKDMYNTWNTPSPQAYQEPAPMYSSSEWT